MSTENATPAATTTRGIHIENLATQLARVSDLDAVNARLVKHGLPKVEDLSVGATQLARASGVKSQGDVAVLVVNLTSGRVQPDDLTRILAAAFPGSKVGERHGPHYLSLARTGKLKGVEIDGTIAHRTRKTKGATVVVPAVTTSTPAPAPAPVEPEAPAAPAVDTEALTAELEGLSQKELAARAKAVGVKAIGKKDAIIKGIIAVS